MSNHSQQSSKIIEIVGNRSILCRPGSKPIENEGGGGGKIVDWKSFQDLVQRWIFRWRADRYREKHGRPGGEGRGEFAKSSPLRNGKEIESHRDPIDPRPPPPQLYLIKNDRGGSARPSSHSSLSLLYPSFPPRGLSSYSRASPLAPVFRIGLIKLNEPSHRGIASQLRYFLWPCPPLLSALLSTGYLLHRTGRDRILSLLAHVFLPFLACRGKLGGTPLWDLVLVWLCVRTKFTTMIKICLFTEGEYYCRTKFCPLRRKL